MKKLAYLFATLILIFSVGGCSNSNELFKSVSSQTPDGDDKNINDSANQPTNQHEPNLVTKTSSSSMCLLSLDEFNSISKNFKFIATGTEVHETPTDSNGDCSYYHYKENGEKEYNIDKTGDIIAISIKAGKYTDDMTGDNSDNAPDFIGFSDRDSVVPSRKGFYDIACDDGACISNTEKDIAKTMHNEGQNIPHASIILYDDCWIQVTGSGVIGTYEKLVKAITDSDVFKGKCALLQTVQEKPKNL